MTENEYLILLSSLREEGSIQAQFFVAIFSAYILAIYTVGKELSKQYLMLLTLSYTLFIAIPALASHVAVSNIVEVAESFSQAYPDAMVEHTLVPYMPVYNSLLLVFCWLLSIIFTLTHRREK
ncbi:MAG: hypothetical protein AB8B95_14735 [Pseudohongiellaceae bacterium]